MVTNQGPRERRRGPTRPALGLCLALILVASATAQSLFFSPPVHSQELAATSVPLGKGLFLVASPDLLDSNFRQTVILICDHGAEGTLGLVLNRPTNLLLSEALSDVPPLQGTSHLLFAGGPVQPDALLMLFRLAHEPAKAKRIMKGVYLGGDLKDLNRLATKPEPAEAFRAFAGYAGWAPGQLASELARGSWKVLPADAATIFEKNPASLWQELTEAPEVPGTIQAGGQPQPPSSGSFADAHAPIPSAPAGG